MRTLVGGSHLVAEYKQQYAEVLKDMAADVALGQHLRVHATPTTVVDGIPMPSLNVRNFEMALQHEADRLSGAATAVHPPADDPRRAGGTHASSVQIR